MELSIIATAHIFFGVSCRACRPTAPDENRREQGLYAARNVKYPELTLSPLVDRTALPILRSNVQCRSISLNTALVYENSPIYQHGGQDPATQRLSD